MEGRFTKLWGKLVMPVALAVLMGISCINAYAYDSDFGELTLELEKNDLEDLAEREGLGEESEVYEEDESGSLGLDVCFYIRTNVENSLIPDEPSDQPARNYSSAIRVNNAVSDNSFVYDQNITSNLCDDGYTASNSVRNALKVVPSVAEIQSVYSSFDPNSQYVFWYVIKEAGTPSPNRDVSIHVDGVVLAKEASAEPETPGTAEGADIPHVESDLEFEIYSANVEPPFEYDGEDHLIGGYMIRVTDKANGDEAVYTYGPYGDFRGVVFKKLRSAADVSVPGTTFDFMGMAFNVNVDSAYLLVKNPGNYEIPFFFGGKQVSAADIIIRDESGRILDAHTDIKTPIVDNAVSQRKITITAGSTVQNDNGSTITNGSVKVSSGSLLPGHKLVTSIVGSQTGPGESVNEITYYDIVDADGKSYKAMYDVTKENGWLILVKPTGSSASASAGGSASAGSSSSASAGNTASAGSSTGNAAQEPLAEGNANSTVVPGSAQSTAFNSAAVLGAQRNGDASSGLLTRSQGARMSDTSDTGIPAELRIFFIVLCLMAIMVINVKRSNN